MFSQYFPFHDLDIPSSTRKNSNFLKAKNIIFEAISTDFKRFQVIFKQFIKYS